MWELLFAGKVRVHITFIAVSVILQAKCKVILIFVISFIICALNRQCESHAGPHLAIGGCACWLCIHLSTVTYHALLSRTMYDCHAKIMKLSGMSQCMPEYVAKDKVICHNQKCYIPKLEEKEDHTPQG